jgi:hypothetical protein
VRLKGAGELAQVGHDGEGLLLLLSSQGLLPGEGLDDGPGSGACCAGGEHFGGFVVVGFWWW